MEYEKVEHRFIRWNGPRTPHHAVRLDTWYQVYKQKQAGGHLNFICNEVGEFQAVNMQDYRWTTKTEKKPMSKLSNIAALVNDNVTTIAATFTKGPADKQYTYKVLKVLAAELSPGDLVIADGAKGYAVLWVHEVHTESQIDPEAEYEYKWAFQKVDRVALLALQEAEAKVVAQLDSARRESDAAGHCSAQPNPRRRPMTDIKLSAADEARSLADAIEGLLNGPKVGKGMLAQEAVTLLVKVRAYLASRTAAPVAQEPVAWRYKPSGSDRWELIRAPQYMDGLSSLRGVVPEPLYAVPQGPNDAPGLDWLDCLAADVSAIDSWHRGSPSYEHDAGWMKEQVLAIIERHRKATLPK